MSSPLIRRRSVIAAKAEATKGTGETLTNAEIVLNAFDIDYKYQIAHTIRETTGSMSMNPAVHGTRSAKVTFKTYVAGNGTNGADTVTLALLHSCGFDNTTTNAAALTSSYAKMSTVTLGFYVDGKVMKVVGAMGDVKIKGEIGKPLVYEFEYTGLLVDDADAALLIPAALAITPPVMQSITLTIGSYTPRISAITISANNAIELREDATQATGYLCAFIADRGYKVTLDPEADLVASKDWLTEIKAHTTAVLTMAVGATTGNIITMTAPAAQTVDKQLGMRNKNTVDHLDLVLVSATAGGNDEFLITYS